MTFEKIHPKTDWRNGDCDFSSSPVIIAATANAMQEDREQEC